MASAADALDLLVARIESHAPARDPSIAYSHQTRGLGDSPVERGFTIELDPSLEFSAAYAGDPVRLRVVVTVEYAPRMEHYTWLQDALTDAEDLATRIRYVNGGEWAQADGYGFRVLRTEVRDLLVRLTIEATYNLTVG